VPTTLAAGRKWLKTHWPDTDWWKKRLEVTQAVVTIAGIIVGAIWTHRLFFVQREGYAHATFEEKASQVPLSKDLNLVQVVLKLENTGHSLIKVTHTTVRIQQVLPITGCDAGHACAAQELNTAATTPTHVSELDRFDWRPIATREDIVNEPIEPGEKAILDFEFVVPSSVQVARIYGFIQNDELTGRRATPVGWNYPLLYDFRKENVKEVTK
jgi:hypothetical protein